MARARIERLLWRTSLGRQSSLYGGVAAAKQLPAFEAVSFATFQAVLQAHQLSTASSDFGQDPVQAELRRAELPGRGCESFVEFSLLSCLHSCPDLPAVLWQLISQRSEWSAGGWRACMPCLKLATLHRSSLMASETRFAERRPLALRLPGFLLGSACGLWRRRLARPAGEVESIQFCRAWSSFSGVVAREDASADHAEQAADSPGMACSSKL